MYMQYTWNMEYKCNMQYTWNMELKDTRALTLESFSQVTVLKSELERVEAEHEVHQEVLEARKRERERMEGRFEQQQRQQERKDAELREQLQDARAVAQREQEAALSKAKELAIARVKQQALRAMGKQRARLQAAEDLAHERKMEDEKERRIAAKEATELRLQQQQQRMVQQQQAPTNEASAAAERRGSRGRVAIAAGAQTEGGSGNRALKEAVTTNVAQELKAYERKIAAQEKMAVKKAVVEARKAASAKVDSMAEQLHRVENKLWRKEQSKQLAIENVFGSLGAYSPHAMTKIHTTPRASERTQPTAAPPQQVPQGASRRSSAPLTVAARAEERRGVAAAHAATQPHAAHESEAQQLAMAKALGFSSVHALEKHEQQVRGGVNLWGLPDGGEKRVAAARAMPNPAAVEKMREEEAAAAKPHAPQHQVIRIMRVRVCLRV